MTDRELMQHALEALEKIAAYRPLTFAECSDAEAVMGIAEKAIPALRERMAQPEQKTCLVANESCKHGSWCSEVYCQEHFKFVEQPAQPEQEPIDSAEKASAYLDARLWEFIDMAAAWPQAKPDPRTWGHVLVYAPKRQEPVAIVVARQYEDGSHAGNHLEWRGRNEADDFSEGTTFYTTPPQRKPLTDEEIEREWQFLHDEEGNPPDHHDFARAIEAKLKERNHE